MTQSAGQPQRNLHGGLSRAVPLDIQIAGDIEC